MKQQIRILGIDDSPFKFKDKRALVVGALVRIPNYLEGVMRTEVTVDGADSTAMLVEMVSKSRYKDQIKAAFGGHFGRLEFPWEQLNKVEELKAAMGL